MRTLIAIALLAIPLAGCVDDETEPEDREITLRFDATVGGETVACGATYDAVGSQATSMRLQDFRFYVSEVELIAADGEIVPLELTEDGLWQGQGVTLIDFEDGSADCSANGNAELNAEIRGTAPDLDYTGVRFTLGVPAEMNHQDTATADAPLNLGSMFWVWQSGYKFLRVDMVADVGGETVPWFIHLGSTGCVSDAPTAAPATECAHSNRATVSLTDFDVDSSVIVADLGALLADVDIATNTPDSPPGCMSGPADEAECVQLFSNFGMDFSTGATLDCAEDGCQDLFFVR